VKTCKLCTLFGFPKDKVQPLPVMMDKLGMSLPDSFCCTYTSGKVIAIRKHLHGTWGGVPCNKSTAA
jgi:hypothetical protein